MKTRRFYLCVAASVLATLLFLYLIAAHFSPKNVPSSLSLPQESPLVVPKITPLPATPFPRTPRHCTVIPGAFAVDSTPYDRYLDPLRDVFEETRDSKDPSMEEVQVFIREGRAFHYSHTRPYLPASPEETAARHAGDCKDKALWLLEKMRGDGVFIVGKLSKGEKLSHAWLEWENQGTIWILDATMLNKPVPRNKIGRNEYIRLYGYTREHSFQFEKPVSIASAPH